jgi:hypothetical protein
MPEPDLSLHMLSGRLRLGELPVVEPPEDLWARIAAAQRQRAAQARSRRLRIALGSLGVIVTGAIAGGWLIGRDSVDEIDWQARAQALELRLHAADAPGSSGSMAPETLSELVRLDAALQAAYDGAADRDQVIALWRRRSELLSVLLRAREQNIEISRI